MRNLAIYLSALTALSQASALRHGSHQLRDLLAFPKYSVDYLNELPLSKTDAERCKLEGVELEEEFTQTRFEGRKKLKGNETEEAKAEKLELIPMKLPSLDGQYQHDYLCLMPSENSTLAQLAQEDDHEEVDPAQGWAALSHLDGKCLYTQQGYWFTYSYCHNDHIRQFRQAPHKHPHPPGGFIPEVDSRYESYVLGRATRSPSTVPKDKSDKQLKSKRKGGSQSDSGHKTGGSGKGTSIDRLDKDHAVSYGLQPSSRYLVQHWQDGTKCDMNGKPREIEVQIHCSMTTTDSIYLIKETSICNYIMIIHSPHLCGLPGFRADHSDVEMAKVRCREVISDDDFEKWMKGEEVVMPFLTIGKGLEPVMGEGDKSINQEEGKYEEMQMEEGVTINGLKDALNQLLGSDGIKGDNQGDEGEVMLITLEEDGDEPIVLQADIIGGEGEGGDGMDRETIMKLVKEYLRKKDKPKRKATVDGDGNGDEDSKNDEDIHKVREEL